MTNPFKPGIDVINEVAAIVARHVGQPVAIKAKPSPEGIGVYFTGPFGTRLVRQFATNEAAIDYANAAWLRVATEIAAGK